MSSHRRAGGAAAGGAPRHASDQNSLHRCAIAFCAQPAVAEGVCEMHHSNSSSSSSRVMSHAGPSRAASFLANNSLNSGGGPGSYLSSSSPSSSGYADEMPDRYRAGVSNIAIQPQQRATKKQKPNQTDTNGRSHGGQMMMGGGSMRGGSSSFSMGGGSSGKQYPALTQESLNQMAHRMKYAKGPTPMSVYDESPYLPSHHQHQQNQQSQHHQSQHQAKASTTGSIHSGDSDHSGDPDTNLRRERNRIAARKSRQRKLDRISDLEGEKLRLEQHRDMLVQEIRSLEKKDSGVVSNAVMTITDKEYASLQNVRMQIIKSVEQAYNSGDIFSTMQFFREDSIVSGPQNSSVHLRGKDALVLDFLCTTYLFRDMQLQHVNVDSGGPRSQHFRVHWVFSGIVKSAGVSMNKEFLELIESVKGKRVKIEGVSNFSFSGDKIVYVHRTADQAKFLSALVNLSKE